MFGPASAGKEVKRNLAINLPQNEAKQSICDLVSHTLRTTVVLNVLLSMVLPGRLQIEGVWRSVLSH